MKSASLDRFGTRGHPSRNSMRGRRTSERTAGPSSQNGGGETTFAAGMVKETVDEKTRDEQSNVYGGAKSFSRNRAQGEGRSG